MAKNNKTNEKAAVIMAKTLSFLKHNVYYILMGVCIIALATVITIAAVVNSNKPEENEMNSNTPIDTQIEQKKPVEDKPKEVEPDIDKPNDSAPTIAEKFYVIAPLDSYTIQKEFTNTQLVYNPTQKHWTTHEGIDMMAKQGSEVKCVYDGVVKDVQTNSFYGTVVVISHKDGYESIYKLLDEVKVKVGDKILKNEKIGVISKDAIAEINDGPHLHFELRKDGVNIDPMEYLTAGNK